MCGALPFGIWAILFIWAERVLQNHQPSALSRLEQYEQTDLLTSSEETDVNSDITTTDKIEEVAQLNSSDSDKVKLYIEFYLL